MQAIGPRRWVTRRRTRCDPAVPRKRQHTLGGEQSCEQLRGTERFWKHYFHALLWIVLDEFTGCILQSLAVCGFVTWSNCHSTDTVRPAKQWAGFGNQPSTTVCEVSQHRKVKERLTGRNKGDKERWTNKGSSFSVSTRSIEWSWIPLLSSLDRLVFGGVTSLFGVEQHAWAHRSLTSTDWENQSELWRLSPAVAVRVTLPWLMQWGTF